VCESWNNYATATDKQSSQCSLAVLVVWFVAHRTINVHKVKFVKLEIVRIFIKFLYLIWTYIIQRRTALFWVIVQRAVLISYQFCDRESLSFLTDFLNLSGNSLTTFRDNLSVIFSSNFWPLVVISYRRFGTTYRSQLQLPFSCLICSWRGTDRFSWNISQKFPQLAP
jgi:hypothetical protein